MTRSRSFSWTSHEVEITKDIVFCFTYVRTVRVGRDKYTQSTLLWSYIFFNANLYKRCNRDIKIGQRLWLSWLSGRFQYQKSAV